MEASAKSQLLGRIAEALQVPQDALYSPLDTIPPGQVAGGAGALDLEQDCEALLRAYRRICDPEMRDRLLTLVQAEAERA